MACCRHRNSIRKPAMTSTPGTARDRATSPPRTWQCRNRIIRAAQRGHPTAGSGIPGTAPSRSFRRAAISSIRLAGDSGARVTWSTPRHRFTVDSHRRWERPVRAAGKPADSPPALPQPARGPAGLAAARAMVDLRARLPAASAAQQRAADSVLLPLAADSAGRAAADSAAVTRAAALPAADADGNSPPPGHLIILGPTSLPGYNSVPVREQFTPFYSYLQIYR